MSDKRTVLIVDDTLANIDQMVDILSVKYKTKVATNGAKALKIAAGTQPPDIILLDINMPNMNGYEVCKYLKEDKKQVTFRWFLSLPKWR